MNLSDDLKTDVGDDVNLTLILRTQEGANAVDTLPVECGPDPT